MNSRRENRMHVRIAATIGALTFVTWGTVVNSILRTRAVWAVAFVLAFFLVSTHVTRSHADNFAAITFQAIDVDASGNVSFEVGLFIDYFEPATIETIDFQLDTEAVPVPGTPGDNNIDFILNIQTLDDPDKVNVSIAGIGLHLHELFRDGPNPGTLSTEADDFFMEPNPQPEEITGFFPEPPNLTTNTVGEIEGATWLNGRVDPGETATLGMTLNFVGPGLGMLHDLDSSYRLTLYPVPEPATSWLLLTGVPLLLLGVFQKRMPVLTNCSRLVKRGSLCNASSLCRFLFFSVGF